MKALAARERRLNSTLHAYSLRPGYVETPMTDDPDPGVREALARHIAGEPEPRTSLASYAAVGVLLVLCVQGVAEWRRLYAAQGVAPADAIP